MARFPKVDIMSLIAETPRFDLAESVGPDIRLGELLDASGGSDFDDLALGYGTAQGDAALRQLVADAHGVDAEDVVITVGGMHALFLIAFILCDPGDRAVTTSPLFPVARSTLESVGAEIATLPLAFDDGYRIDLDALEKLLTADTKLVSLASPQNPSGVAISPNTVEEIIALMDRTCPDARLLMDETYREAVYGDETAASSAVNISPKIVCCASLSKCHGTPGLRLGWVVTRDAAFREQLLLGKFTTVISCSAIDEALATKVLEQRERIIGDRRRHLGEGLSRTADWVAQHDSLVDWIRPDAGALCCIRLKPGIFDDAAVARFYETLSPEGLRVADGAWFGETSRVFRLGFGFLSIQDLEAALEAMTRALVRVAREAA